MKPIESDADVRACIERAWTAIDEDAPDFGSPLRALAESRDALRFLERHAEVARPLFVELRKLRPLPLWVRDEVEPALIVKRDAVLDGALCRIASDTSVLRPEGRECWLEVEAHTAETTLRALPGGWGLVVTSDLAQVSFAALRRLSPLRAIGAVVTEDQAPALLAQLAGAKLDLVLADAPRSLDAGQFGARVLWSVRAADDLLRTEGVAPSVGVVCDAASAMAWALRLATARRPQHVPT